MRAVALLHTEGDPTRSCEQGQSGGSVGTIDREKGEGVEVREKERVYLCSTGIRW